jgi:hypothetical protein
MGIFILDPFHTSQTPDILSRLENDPAHPATQTGTPQTTRPNYCRGRDNNCDATAVHAKSFSVCRLKGRGAKVPDQDV